MKIPKKMESLFPDEQIEYADLLAHSDGFREIHEDYETLLGDLNKLIVCSEPVDPAALQDIKAALSGLADDASDALKAYRQNDLNS